MISFGFETLPFFAPILLLFLHENICIRSDVALSSFVCTDE